MHFVSKIMAIEKIFKKDTFIMYSYWFLFSSKVSHVETCVIRGFLCSKNVVDHALSILVPWSIFSCLKKAKASYKII